MKCRWNPPPRGSRSANANSTVAPVLRARRESSTIVNAGTPKNGADDAFALLGPLVRQDADDAASGEAAIQRAHAGARRAHLFDRQIAAHFQQQRFDRGLPRRAVDDRERRARGEPVVEELPATEVRRGDDESVAACARGVEQASPRTSRMSPERVLRRAAPDRRGLGNGLAGFDEARACDGVSLFASFCVITRERLRSATRRARLCMKPQDIPERGAACVHDGQRQDAGDAQAAVEQRDRPARVGGAGDEGLWRRWRDERASVRVVMGERKVSASPDCRRTAFDALAPSPSSFFDDLRHEISSMS